MLSQDSTTRKTSPANQSELTEARLRFALEVEATPLPGRSPFVGLADSLNTFALFAHAVVERG